MQARRVQTRACKCGGRAAACAGD
uniref:Uncharacterized protein n=1 Tax=Arundo donax TaxID=35708 RepID=A0A0A9G4R6_ARUDO